MKRYLSILALLVGTALIVVSAALLRDGGALQASSFDYGPGDVAHEDPFQAVHEMETGPPIPFLPKEGPQPRIELNDVFHNFGSVGATEVVTREFAFANAGDAPLTISRAYTTCGCTVADFSAAVVPPGKVAVVTVRFDAGFHDTRGQTVRRGIIIESNDPERPQTEFWMEASVRSSG